MESTKLALVSLSQEGLSQIQHLYLLAGLFLPLLTVLFFLFVHGLEKRQGQSYRTLPGLAVLVQGLTAVASLMLAWTLWQTPPQLLQFDWLVMEPFLHWQWSILLNSESLFMLALVNGIAFLVMLYSLSYMAHDSAKNKYFSFLAFFVLAMDGLVVSGNLLQAFVFWELVGLASYLLIGFWNSKGEPARSSLKAILVNKVGDVAFLIALAAIWDRYHTFDLVELQNLAGPDMVKACSCYTVIGWGLLIAAMAKSAQVPLSVWLSDAMAGPTPVSSLMHAATMVAAGIYLIARSYFLFNLNLLTAMAIIGALTALMGALTALFQRDIKKLLAYSTISQLGYMMMGLGVGAYQESLFHLLTHAFFKCCLFLCAGVLIHALKELGKELKAEGSKLNFDPQDLYLMGGLRQRFPWVFVAYTLSAASLAGLPLMSGFLSKDAIVAGAVGWADRQASLGFALAWLVPAIAYGSILLTALYVGRHYLLVFFGQFRLPHFLQAQVANPALGVENKSRLDHLYGRLHQPKWAMRLPLAFLALVSLAFVFSVNPLDGQQAWFLEALSTPQGSLPTIFHIHEYAQPYHVMGYGLSIAFAAIGLGLAYRRWSAKPLNVQAIPHPGDAALWLGSHFRLNYVMVFLPSQFFRELGRLSFWADRALVDKAVYRLGQSQVVLAHLSAWTDRWIVEGLVNGIPYLLRLLGRAFTALVRGGVQAWLVFVLTLLLVIYFFSCVSTSCFSLFFGLTAFSFN